jgi:hypothetical protein
MRSLHGSPPPPGQNKPPTPKCGNHAAPDAWLAPPPPPPPQVYALKLMHKAPLQEAKQIEHVYNERRILGEAMHPFLVQMVGAYQDAHNLYLLQVCGCVCVCGGGGRRRDGGGGVGWGVGRTGAHVAQRSSCGDVCNVLEQGGCGLGSEH